MKEFNLVKTVLISIFMVGLAFGAKYVKNFMPNNEDEHWDPEGNPDHKSWQKKTVGRSQKSSPNRELLKHQEASAASIARALASAPSDDSPTYPSNHREQMDADVREPVGEEIDDQTYLASAPKTNQPRRSLNPRTKTSPRRSDNPSVVHSNSGYGVSNQITVFSNASLHPPKDSPTSLEDDGSITAPNGTTGGVVIAPKLDPLVVTSNRSSGYYLHAPTITLSSSGADGIKYCIGHNTSGTCCDPENGLTYTGPFSLAPDEGNYCVGAISHQGSRNSASVSWQYIIGSSLISLNLTLPEKKVFQTHQLHELITVNSSQFGDSTLTFIQRISHTEAGPSSCDILSTTSSPLDDMETSLGFMVNFGSVTSPFSVPLRLNNKLRYGKNHVASIVERAIASSDPEYFCLNNTIEVRDFHIEGQAASAMPASPDDGNYIFQGSLNWIGSQGKAVGTHGTILESGFFNIIN